MTELEVIAILLFGVIFLVLLGCCYGYYSEKKEWNDGVCAENGLPWVYFDTNSQGGRGYRAGNVYMWVSWLKEA